MNPIMSSVTGLVVVLLGLQPALSTERWTKVATDPYTLNNKQDALAFPSARVGYYGNGTGRVYRSDDGGRHWRVVWHHPGTYVRALDFADEKTGWLGNVGPGYFSDVRDTQPLYVTHDSGLSWTPVVPLDGPAVAGICALDVLKGPDGRVAAVRAGGRVGGPAGMLESLDGGETFHARDMSAVTGMILDIHFLDANTGFLAGATESDEDKAHARILKTTDGGRTWRAVFESARAGDNNWKLAFSLGADRLRDDHELQGTGRRGARRRGQDHRWRRALDAADRDARPRLGALRDRLPQRDARVGGGRFRRFRDHGRGRLLAPRRHGPVDQQDPFRPKAGRRRHRLRHWA